MQEPGTIYIERNDCGNCYRCVRECGVKAIAVVDGRPRIDYQRCIACGDCVAVCKPGVIRFRNDTHLAREIIKKYTVKVASVSPQWITEFPGLESDSFIEALKLLGFTHVSESALGAEATLPKELEILHGKGGIGISSKCPAVVSYIRRFRPRLNQLLLPLASPAVAHARMIKSWWGSEAQVVHITSCGAAKQEASLYPGLVSAVLTYNELKRWFKEEGIQSDKLAGHHEYQFEPSTAKYGNNYILPGNSSASLEGVRMSATGFHSIVSLLDRAPVTSEVPVMLDLMMCGNGCLSCAGGGNKSMSLIESNINISNLEKRRSRIGEKYILPAVDLTAMVADEGPVDSFVAESDTLMALDALGLESLNNQTDCGACGWKTCRRFAKALSKGDVVREMCWQYVRNEISSKFTSLITRMSSGVAIVGSNMRIEQANRLLATMMGPEAEYSFDQNPGWAGVACQEVLPFSSLISMALENGDDSLVRDIQVKERILTVSVHTIQKYKSVLVICRNMLFSQVRNEEIVARSQKVIRENLETVQKIAYMLGENASRTEAILNSILYAQSKENDS